MLKGTAATVGHGCGRRRHRRLSPPIHADDPITIRYAGTGVNAFRELSEKCKEDIGIDIQYTTLTSDDVVKRAVTQPTSFDLLDSEYWMLKKIVPSGNLRGMDISKHRQLRQGRADLHQGRVAQWREDLARRHRADQGQLPHRRRVDGVRVRTHGFHDPDPDGLQRRHPRASVRISSAGRSTAGPNC